VNRLRNLTPRRAVNEDNPYDFHEDTQDYKDKKESDDTVTSYDGTVLRHLSKS